MNVASTAETISPLSVGSPLPDGTLIGMDSTKVSLHTALQGKAGILIFYRGSW